MRIKDLNKKLISLELMGATAGDEIISNGDVAKMAALAAEIIKSIESNTDLNHLLVNVLKNLCSFTYWDSESKFAEFEIEEIEFHGGFIDLINRTQTVSHSKKKPKIK